MQSVVETVVGEGIRTYFEETRRSPRASTARRSTRSRRRKPRASSATSSSDRPSRVAVSQPSSPTARGHREGRRAVLGGVTRRWYDEARPCASGDPRCAARSSTSRRPVDTVSKTWRSRRSSARSGQGFPRPFDPERLRYGKIIVMTDADIDKVHIRTLVTLFYQASRAGDARHATWRNRRSTRSRRAERALRHGRGGAILAELVRRRTRVLR